MNKKKSGNKKRTLFFLFMVLAVLLLSAVLLISAAAGWKYHKIASSGEKPFPLAGSFSCPEKVTLGELFTVTIKYHVPWGTTPVEAAFSTVPENMHVTAPPFFETTEYGWGYRIIEGKFPLQGYIDGKSKGGGFLARFRSRKGVESLLEEKIPSVVILPVKTQSKDLLTAGVLMAEKAVNMIPYLAVILVILLVAGGLLFFLIYRKRGKKIYSIAPWEKAVSAIKELLSKVRKGDARVEQSIAELSDIVRRYMEQRFAIRAEHQTSDEFFLALNSRKGILTEVQQEFLRKFMRSADLVKFAKLSADLSLMEEAASQAENLVRETIPSQEEMQEKSRKKGKKK